MEDLIRSFGRPLTTYEIDFLLEGLVSRRRVYNEIRVKIKYGIFRDFILDFKPFYRKQVRLVGLNSGDFTVRFQKKKGGMGNG